MSTITQARRAAQRTPAERNRYVDFLRAFSILVVVFGHWLMAGPQMVDGRLQVGHLLAQVRWTQWATWILQVMPIFFFVGGYANAAGWRAARRNGVLYGRWLRDRLRRLVIPVLPVLAVWAVIASLAGRLGVDADLIRIGSQAALVPVWFLATYVVIVMLAPATLALWEGHGWTVVAVSTLAAAAVDVANLAMGITWVAWLNYLFVWNAVHMLGYAWADRRIGAVGRRLAIAVTGLASLFALVAAGPYPVAMVGLDNTAVTNSNPPKVTLIALGMFQFGLAMAMEGPARRWLERLRTWTAVVAINGSIMTIYLWHLTAMVAVLGGLLAAGGPGLRLAVGTGVWWATRPIWLTVMIVATLPLLMAFSRYERPATDRRPAPPAWQPVLAVVAVCAGLGLLARFGIADADGLNGLALSLPVAGLALGGVVGARRWERRRAAAV